MATVYGVCNHTPMQLATWLRDIHNIKPGKDLTSAKYGVVFTEDNISSLRSYIVLQSASDLRRNLQIINSLQNHIVFVFDSPMTLWEYDGIIPLDYGDSEDVQTNGIQLYDYFLELTYNDRQISRAKDRNYLKSAIASVGETGSFLRPFMTFVYTMPKATHQKPVKVLACLSIKNNASKAKLGKILSYLNTTVGLPEAKQAKFMSLLTSEEVDKYKGAFVEYNAKECDIQLLCKRHGISSYEFSYILSIVKTATDVDGENMVKIYKGIK